MWSARTFSRQNKPPPQPCRMHVQHVTTARRSLVGWAAGRWTQIRADSLIHQKTGWPRRRCDPAAICHDSMAPFPSNTHHQSTGDCLEGKRENYRVGSVQYFVQQLYTVNCTHIWTDLTVLGIGFCLTGPISPCLDSFLCMYYLCLTVYCMHV